MRTTGKVDQRGDAFRKGCIDPGYVAVDYDLSYFARNFLTLSANQRSEIRILFCYELLQKLLPDKAGSSGDQYLL
ncbi:hypothetical protein D9M71_756800 [compost metagenome]